VLRFFKQIDKTVPRDLDIHVVLDNLSAHKAPIIKDWLARPRQSRWHLHYTPTSSSWLNLVEHWFRELTERRLKRGSFCSLQHLTDAITLWAEHWNENPKPFVCEPAPTPSSPKSSADAQHSPTTPIRCQTTSRYVSFKRKPCKECNDTRLQPAGMGRDEGKPWPKDMYRRWSEYCRPCGRDKRLAEEREKRRQARADRICASCGEPFTPSRSDGCYCSSRCRQSAYRQRRTEATA
jgi:transposase